MIFFNNKTSAGIYQIEMNNSKNPFAYMRTEEDIQSLTDALLRNCPKDNMPGTFALQFLQFLIRYVMELDINDRNFFSMRKLLEIADPSTETKENDFHTLFEELLQGYGSEEIKQRYSVFKEKFAGLDDVNYKEMLTQCLNVLPAFEELNCRQIFDYKKDLMQAEILAPDGSVYEFWFEIKKDFNEVVEVSYISDQIVKALVYIDAPITQLNGNFILYLIGWCHGQLNDEEMNEDKINELGVDQM